jgi:hypothetical protein
MRRYSVRSLVLVALLGGLAIHGALLACSGSGNAGAQTSSCQQWAVTDIGGLYLPSTGPSVQTSGGTLQTTSAPAGWEPIGSIGSNYLFRKCTQ